MLNAAHLARVDLNLLVLFHVVLEEGHVGRAAARLNLTPSAVSHGLAGLRRLLSDPLFLRTPKGVVPTTRALALNEEISAILKGVQGVLNAAVPFDAATSQRRFVLGAPDAVLAATMVPLLARIADEAPHIVIGLIHTMPARPRSPKDEPWAGALSKLERREIDVALLPLQAVPPRFAARHVYDETFVVAMRSGHPFARRPSLAAFCASQHLLVTLSGDPHGFVDEMLAKRGLKRRIGVTVPSFMMALAHLPSSNLLAVLPRSLLRQYATRFGLIAAGLPLKRKADQIQAVATKAALMDAGVAWVVDTLAHLSIDGDRDE
jgi:DNA-binding transcriptional LysR family regulator